MPASGFRVAVVTLNRTRSSVWWSFGKAFCCLTIFHGRRAKVTVEALYDVLVEQIHRALFARCPHQEGTPQTRQLAQERAQEFLSHAERLQALLHEDVLATYNGDPSASGLDEILLTYPGIFALSIYRIAHVLHDMRVPLLPRMMTEYAHRVTGIDIHPGAQIGHGIMIDHGTGIVIGETAVVGDHVNIYHGVTIGALFFRGMRQGRSCVRPNDTLRSKMTLCCMHM